MSHYLASITTGRYGPLIVHEALRGGQPVLDLYSDDPLNEPVARLTVHVEESEALGADEFFLDPDKLSLQDDLLASGLFQSTGRQLADERRGTDVPIWRICRR